MTIGASTSPSKVIATTSKASGPTRNNRLRDSHYHQIDLALDTFPSNGTTTTCEALWMGVPVLALAGPSHVSRVGVSILSRLGLDDWIASSVDDYISKAAGFAADRSTLSTLRQSLRPRMSVSSLTDAAVFTSALEEAYEMVRSKTTAASNTLTSPL